LNRLHEIFFLQDERLLKIAYAQVLLKAKFHIKPEDFQINSTDPPEIERAYRHTEGLQKQVGEKLSPLEALFQNRLSGAMQLLALPQVISRLESHDAVKKDAERFATAAQILEDHLPALDQLYRQSHQLMILTEHLEKNEDHEPLTSQISITMDEVRTTLESLKISLTKIAYPFEHSQPKMTVGRYLFSQVPDQDDLQALLETSESVTAKMQRLYARLVARLTHTAEQVEKLVGLSELPEPPSE
jgi:hypothetical protein